LLSAAAARAVVVARLVSAMYGRSGVGREAAEFLAALVNRGA
jgi:histidine ammonia-lyase